MSPKRSGEGIPVFVPAAETRTPRSQSVQPVNNSPRALGFGGDGGREMPADAFALVARFFLQNRASSKTRRFRRENAVFPQARSFRGDFAKPMKTKIALLLVALAGVSSAVLAEMTNTPSALYAAPSAERKGADKLLDPAGDCLTERNPDRKQWWDEIEKKVPVWKDMLTPRFKKLVDSKRDYINFAKSVRSKDERKNIHRNSMAFVFYQTDALGIYLSGTRRIFVVPLTFGAAEWIAPQKTPLKKPYVSLSPKLKAELSRKDAVYLETLAEVLNENLHFMFSPIPQLTLKEMYRGAYLGKLLLIPTRFKPVSLEDVSQDPTLKDTSSFSPKRIKYIRNRYKDYIPQKYYDEAYLMKHLAGGNPLKFEIQKRLGAPLWNIGETFPDIVTPVFGLTCSGIPALGGVHEYLGLFPFSVVPLTNGEQMIKGSSRKAVLPRWGGNRQAILTRLSAYGTYFKSMRASFKTLQEDWRAELEKEGLSKDVQPKTLRQKAFKELDAQLRPLIRRAEHTLEGQSEWCKSGWGMIDIQVFAEKKVPHSLL